MTVGIKKRAVGIFSTAREAEHALRELSDAGFPLERVSVIARNSDRVAQIGDATRRDADGSQADEGATAGAIAGGALGGLTGLLVGLGALAIPGLGPVFLAGATATALATTASGAAIGAVAGGLIGALIGLGIPEEQATVYNERVTAGEYLVMVDGTEEEIRRAEAVLHGRGIQEWGIYDVPAAATTGIDYRSDTTTATQGVAPDYHVAGDATASPQSDRDIVTIVDRRG